ncbi:hypothetical protein CVV65_15310 [Kyrpidia spormannii]|uniref:Uncharacterized protein n=3 Tax=Kyrpidia spormannii TaxID=2055160 RepID=A0A2K8NCR2_9BACL|nr:hypothetical protein [Kyrpidia sp.]ATY86122.1 hypothetical protein CVV65_15310 [Kyrpidia spormannii]CAB3395394.1 conserved protein of unknown function [Kyrpidia spormannii]CAB3396125.1 conserved protein of unknown function [Kyrpidia spormannii]
MEGGAVVLVDRVVEAGHNQTRRPKTCTCRTGGSSVCAHPGSIEVGKRADLILVEPAGNHPVVRRTIVGGSVVYRADYA